MTGQTAEEIQMEIDRLTETKNKLAEFRQSSEEGRYEAARWLIKNIVTLPNFYYDLATHAVFNTDKKLNAYYGHLWVIGETPAGRPTTIKPAEQLAANPDKLTAQNLCWQPIKEKDFTPILWLDDVRMVNTFKPLKITPIVDDVSEWLQLVKHICGDYADLVLDHMAFTVQHPEEKIAWQVLVIGKPRTGKTAIFMPLVQIYGESASIVKGDDVKTGWGDAFYQKKVVLIEEVYDYDAKMFNSLKPKLSNYGIEYLNMKGAKPIAQPNVYSIYMLTNKAAPFQMDENEGKLLVIKAPDNKIYGEGEDSKDFYDLLHRLYKAPEYTRACFGYLMERDVSKFCSGTLPVRTQALLDTCEESKADFVKLLEELIMENAEPFCNQSFKMRDVKAVLRQHHMTPGDKGVGTVLRDLGYEPCKGQRKISGKNATLSFWALEKDVEGMSSRELHDFGSGVKKLVNNANQDILLNISENNL